MTYQKSFVIVVVTMAACGKAPTAKMPSLGERAPISETMADAPMHDVPGTIEVKPPCNGNGYMKVDVAAGAPFSIDVAPATGCASIAVLNASGGVTGEGSIEVCADEPKTLSSTA